MAIVSSTIQRDHRHIVELHTDHLGQSYMQTWFAPNDWTEQQIEARVAEHAAQIEQSLADAEFEQVIG